MGDALQQDADVEKVMADHLKQDAAVVTRSRVNDADLTPNHFRFVYGLHTFPGFDVQVGKVHCPMSKMMKKWRGEIRCEIDTECTGCFNSMDRLIQHCKDKGCYHKGCEYHLGFVMHFERRQLLRHNRDADNRGNVVKGDIVLTSEIAKRGEEDVHCHCCRKKLLKKNAVLFQALYLHATRNVYCIKCGDKLKDTGKFTTELISWEEWMFRNAKFRKACEQKVQSGEKRRKINHGLFHYPDDSDSSDDDDEMSNEDHDENAEQLDASNEDKDSDDNEKKSGKSSENINEDHEDEAAESDETSYNECDGHSGSDMSDLSSNGEYDEEEEQSWKRSRNKKRSAKKKDGGQESVTIGEAVYNRRSERMREKKLHRIDLNMMRIALEGAHARRQKAKDDTTTTKGILVGRRDFQGSHGFLLSGNSEDCIADAVAMALGIPQAITRDFIGQDHTFICASACVRKLRPGSDLISASAKCMIAGGVELALLRFKVGLFFLKMSYTPDGEKSKGYHCALFDANLLWERDTVERGVIVGRGVLKDNQTDVLVHLAEKSDRKNQFSARAFFQYPYKCRMRIEAVYELVDSCPKSSIRDVLCV